MHEGRKKNIRSVRGLEMVFEMGFGVVWFVCVSDQNCTKKRCIHLYEYV